MVVVICTRDNEYQYHFFLCSWVISGYDLSLLKCIARDGGVRLHCHSVREGRWSSNVTL